MATSTRREPTPTPFAFLTPQQLRGLAVFFAADAAAVGVTVESMGRYGATEVLVTRRDLQFIHRLDAGRFGPADGCPICGSEGHEA